MIRNYIKIAFRNFYRNKSSFLINVTGLSLGLACSILILLWVMDEMSVDRFHGDIDRIYQVMEHQEYAQGNIITTNATPGILAPALKEEIPEIEFASTYTRHFNYLFSYEDKSLKSAGIYARPDIFRILSFHVLTGNAETWLDEPNTLVLSENTAEKYFGGESVLGKQLLVNNGDVYTVTGVYKDFPANSTFQADFIMPFEDFLSANPWATPWHNNFPQTLVKLLEGSDPNLVNEKIHDFIKERIDGSVVELFIYPFADQYLYGRFDNLIVTGENIEYGRIEYVRIFSVITILVLLIACINFMNLSTARSTKRAKEVGIRKSIGASRGSLVGQYIGESVIISLFSLLMALLLVELTLPFFNNLTGKQISVNYSEPTILLAFVGIAIVTGLIAGSYPAFYLSTFEAVQALKGTIKSSAGELFARKGLVIFQFAAAIILIVSTILIYNQLQYIVNRNLGYQKENLIYLPLEGEISSRWDAFRQEILSLPEVTRVSRADHQFMGRESSTYNVNWPGKDPNSTVLFETFQVDYDLVETLGFELVEGRSFSREFGADSARVLMNQTAVRIMEMEDPIGQTIHLGRNELEIIGVISDFNFQSLLFNVEPIVMSLNPANTLNGFMRVETDNINQTLAQIEQVYKQLNPAFPFEYTFMDRQYESFYRSEMRMGELSKYSALFAIIISCLGLFGLSAFTADQRRKEIGVRKVMGASVHGIVMMLSKDFTRLVFFSMIIAIPASWWLMNRWLEDFAYRIEIGAGVFVLAGLAAVLIALATVSWQSVRAAMMNPVESLRSE